MITSKRQLRRLYRRYLFSYSFEVFAPKPATTTLVPKFQVISNAAPDQILASVATLILA